MRGLVSLITGFAFPLGGLCCRNLRHLCGPERLDRGCVFILPGVEGTGPLNHNVALGLADGSVPFALEIHDWTTGFWPLFLYHLRGSARWKTEAARIASDVLEYQGRYPGRPTFLIGHSGGGALAVKVIESLPSDRSITGAILLAPALSQRYDLTSALSRVEHGIWNFYSPLDCVLLTAGTSIVGTLDGKLDPSAGAWGFRLPRHCSSETRNLYDSKLHQTPYQARMARSWHLGGHLGWANRVFVSEWLAPIITKGALSASVDDA